MNRSELWNSKYDQVWKFVEKNHRAPSRHHIEEYQLLNWMKFNRKKIKANKMGPEELEKFQKLTDFIHTFHRINQYI